jgi:hypothetical protein
VGVGMSSRFSSRSAVPAGLGAAAGDDELTRC